MLVATILAGCGGSSGKSIEVRGTDYSFRAPADWSIARMGRRVSVSQGSKVVQVSTFPLARAYTPALFVAVQPEITRVATQLRNQLHASLSSRTLDVAGRRAWQYDLVHGSVFEQLTFVLRGRREYQLYCRHGTGESGAPCARLVDSFSLG